MSTPEPKTTSLAAVRKEIVPQQIQNLPEVTVGFNSLQSFELVQRAAKLLASSTLVPKEYQNNLPNCVIALEMANRIGAGALQVMQNLYVVHGRPSWSSQFLIATINTCGRFSALRYEFFGKPGQDGWGCRAWAIEKCTGEKLVGSDITIDMAKKEGWFGKTGSKWQTMPQQMLQYRAAAFFVRAYAPELAMGLHTREEILDVPDLEESYHGETSLDALKAELQQAAEEAQNPKVIRDEETGEILEVVVTQPDEPTQTHLDAFAGEGAN